MDAKKQRARIEATLKRPWMDGQMCAFTKTQLYQAANMFHLADLKRAGHTASATEFQMKPDPLPAQRMEAYV